MKRIVVYITFFLFCLFAISYEGAYAAIKDASSVHAGIGGCEAAYKFCWLDKNHVTAPGIQGIRVTVYDENGRRLSNSVDFTNSSLDTINNINNTTYYMASNRNNKSRIEYISDGGIVAKSGQKPSIQYASFDSFIQTSILQEQLLTFSEEEEESIKTAINYCKGEYSSRCSLSSSHYFVVEPLTIIFTRKDEYDYYGTYYELVQMINNSMKFTERNQGVNYFLPGNVGISLYISNTTDEFRSFYNNVHLHPLSTRDVNEVKNLINNQPSGGTATLSNKVVVNTMNRGLGYGVGVIKVKKRISTPTPTNCTVESTVEPCSGSVVYEYKNCPVNLSDVVKDSAISGNALCQITCNEKYHIATWTLNESFHSLSDDGVLAGSYFPINGPTVWHKKTCKYDASGLSDFSRIVNAKINSSCWYEEEIEGCIPTEEKSCTKRVFDRECAAGWREYEDNKREECNQKQQEYNRMDSDQDEANDRLGNAKLTLFSDYQLKAIKTGSPEFNLDGYRYGYKNMYVYKIGGTINHYINMLDIFNDSQVIDTGQNYSNGQAMATTPINVNTTKEYKYIGNFQNILSSSFISVLRRNGVNVSSGLTWSCPYKIIERTTSKFDRYCYGDCNNPDTSFKMPKLNMVYRPIDLSIPFPGNQYSGIGSDRKAGPNWNEEDIKVYITNNRGVKEDLVYQKDALYIIDLDPATIQKIRDYNKNNSYDDFTLECTKGKGTECISKFLREYNLFTGGTCATVTSADNFYSCADK